MIENHLQTKNDFLRLRRKKKHTAKLILELSCVFLLLLSSLFFNPSIDRWNAKPEIYIFFNGTFLVSLIYILDKNTQRKLKLNIIDITLIGFISLLTGFEFADHSLQPFYLRDEYISLVSITSLYIPFKILNRKYQKCIYYLFGAIIIIEISSGTLQFVAKLVNDQPVIGSITGTLQNSGVFSIFLACSLPIILLIAHLQKENKIAILFLLTNILVIIFFVIINNSRTGILLMAITFVFVNKKYLKTITTINKNSRRIIIAITCFLTVASIVWLVMFKFSSSTGRLFIWMTSLTMFSEKPLLGWGLSGFEKYYLYHQSAYFKTNPNTNPAYEYAAVDTVSTFNEYIMILVRCGIIGFGILTFAIYKVQLAYQKVRSANIHYDALAILLILISALFYYTFHVPIILILTIAALSNISNQLPAFQAKEHVRLKWLIPFVKYIPVIAFISFFSYCLLQCKATLLWKKVNDNVEVSNSNSFFRQAYPNLRHRAHFLYNYGAFLFKQKAYTESLKIFEECRSIQPSIDLMLYLGQAYQFTSKYKAAENCFKEASYMMPLRFAPKYFLVHLYLKQGFEDKALLIAKEIMKMPVKVPSVDVENIKYEMEQLIANRPFSHKVNLIPNVKANH